MKYESWHGNNFTRVHTDECTRRPVDSTAENAMQLIGVYDSAEEAVRDARANGHRTKVCKVCGVDRGAGNE